MKSRICLSIIILLVFSAHLPALFDNDEIFQRGVNAYEERNYELALQSFLHLLDEGYNNSQIYYNTGNTYFRLGNLGRAILYYKKGLRLEPYNPLLKANLNYLLSLTQDRQIVEETNPFVEIIEKIVYALPLNSLFILTLILFAIMILLINVMIIFFYRKEKTVPLFILTIMIILFLLSGLITYYRWQYLNDDTEAVLIVSSTTGYSGPAEDYTNLFRIHEGMIFRVNITEAEWSQIALPTGMTGWIRSDTFRKVKLGT